jgi:DNA-binding MarR family transcriptional regulator
VIFVNAAGGGLSVVEASDVWDAPGFLIRRCHQIATGIFIEEAAKQDFTPIQFAALTFVHLQPGLDQRSLGEMIALDRSSVTKCIDRLEQRGFVSRVVSPHDKRARLLQLTESGTAILKDVGGAARRTRERIEGRLGSETLSRLSALLGEMTEKLAETSRVPFWAGVALTPPEEPDCEVDRMKPTRDCLPSGLPDE